MKKPFPIFVAILLSAAFASTTSGAWNNPPKDKIAGLTHGTLSSPSMKVEVGYNICLPPEYERMPQQRFPVI